MFEFLKGQWVMRKVDQKYLQKRVDKGQITFEELEEIINEKQIEV